VLRRQRSSRRSRACPLACFLAFLSVVGKLRTAHYPRGLVGDFPRRLLETSVSFRPPADWHLPVRDENSPAYPRAAIESLLVEIYLLSCFACVKAQQMQTPR